jgi:signal transduction histidine kinase
VASARSRLTTAYAVALAATLVLFTAALSVARPGAAARAIQRPEALALAALDSLNAVAGRGDVTILDRIIVTDSVIRIDTLANRDSVMRTVTYSVDTLYPLTLSAEAKAALAQWPNYLFVVANDGRVLFSSDPTLPADVRETVEFIREIAAPVRSPLSTAFPLRGELVLLSLRPYRDQASGISHVVAGIPVREVVLSVRELMGPIIAITPIVLLISLLGAYMIAGQTLQPIERIINEVAAITDGKSLHRRVAMDGTSDELARLGVTLNAMLSRLETSFDALRRFTADASHELKTPLTVLRADVERAMSHKVSPTEQLVALEEALHETARMADLVESLLTLARADEGRFDLYREPVQMEPLAREVFETAHILGEHAGQTVVLSAVEDAVVQGDRTRLRQLFLNLITNAIKYTPRGGRIDISLSKRIDCITFTVRDTGIGISAGDLPHIFERFYRADRARSRRVQSPDGSWTDERGGFGLGLAISQWIARAHGGTLTATSRLGRGSVFTVSLPLEEVGDAGGDASAPEVGGGSEGPVAA